MVQHAFMLGGMGREVQVLWSVKGMFVPQDLSLGRRDCCKRWLALAVLS